MIYVKRRRRAQAPEGLAPAELVEFGIDENRHWH